jgi:hypothetical protein
VVALKGKTEGDLLQCKSSVKSEVGWDAVKEVSAGAARYQLKFQNTKFRKVAVTNQRFTTGAREHAEANKVVLVQREELEAMLNKHPIHNQELDAEAEDVLGFLQAA